jgi:hypothetical protein
MEGALVIALVAPIEAWVIKPWDIWSRWPLPTYAHWAAAVAVAEIIVAIRLATDRG